jgi:excisionase family DNA binding protein
LVNADPKSEKRRPEGETPKAEAGGSQQLLTSREVAGLLGVSLRTVERMIHDEEIKPVRLRGWLVRFRMEAVTEAVRNGGRKWGRAARLAPDGNPKAEIRNPKAISSERTQGA